MIAVSVRSLIALSSTDLVVFGAIVVTGWARAFIALSSAGLVVLGAIGVAGWARSLIALSSADLGVLARLVSGPISGAVVAVLALKL